jgi:hypothetical protein
MTVTYNDGTTFVTCSDTTLVVCYCDDNDPPIVSLTSPSGGHTLSGTEPISWFALDSDSTQLHIYLFYSVDTGKNWRYITNDALVNNIDQSHGDYDWVTTTLSDGTYMIQVEAVDDYNNVAVATSTPFTINNGNTASMISDVQITDTTTGSSSWVKDGDTITITAGITGGASGLTLSNITADLSGFGKSHSVMASSYDGFVATWRLTNIQCHPSDGPITITVTVGANSNSNTITADNSAPQAVIMKPATGVYFHDMRLLLPLQRIIIIGPITLQINADDLGGIAQVEFYVDNVIQKTVNNEPFNYYLTQKLKGPHTLKFIVYDIAGHTTTLSTEANFINVG